MKSGFYCTNLKQNNSIKLLNLFFIRLLYDSIANRWVGGYVEHIVIVFILSLLLTPAAARQLLETPGSAHCRSSKAYLH